MINTNYKNQPVAAFYKLLASSLLYLLSISLILSAIAFIIIKTSLTNTLGLEGIKELGNFMNGQSIGIKEQSDAMQKFMVKYPSIISAMFGSFALLLVLFSYVFFATQQFLKSQLLKLQTGLIASFIPNKSFFSIVLFIILSSGFLMSAFGFIAISISSSPLMGIIAALFLGTLLMRSSLFIPGLIIGEMSFSESLKYSFQTLSLGRSFKIIIFGTLVFIMLSLIISALLYFPSIWFQGSSFKLYLNILTLFIQIGFISVGLTSIFLRYGNFEEEKITE